MSWFFLSDVPHTRRRGIVMRRRYLFGGEGVLAEAIHASTHYDPEMELANVQIAVSSKDSITFEVWLRDPETSICDIRYVVYYVILPVTDELLEQVCEGDIGRGMKRNWSQG